MRLFALPAPLLSIYLLMCAFVSAFALSSFAKLIQPYLAVEYDFTTELLMVTGQVAFQWLFLIKAKWLAKKHYMIIALTVSLVGSLLLLPLIVCHSFLKVPDIVSVAYFFAVVFAIFLLHYRLIVRSSLPERLTITWVVYRVILLAYVLAPRSA